MIKRERFTNGLKQENACFYLHAGPGFGKTYVVKEFLKEQTEPYCYICFTEADNDIELLKNHIYEEMHLFYGGIIHKIEPQMIQNDLHIENAGHFIYDTADIINVVLQCIQVLCRVQEKLFMVFDNVSSIQNRKCLNLLTMLVDVCKEHSVLFLLSRQEEKWLAKQKISSDCIEIKEEEFYFTVEETKEYLETVLSYSSSLSTNAAKLLMVQFDGWPAGICQCADVLNEYLTDNNQVRWDELLKETSLDIYMKKEILDVISEEEITFLKKVSVCESMTQEFLRKVFFINDSRRWLNQLARTRFFLKKEENEYCVIPAFRKVFMMEQGKEEFQKSLGNVFEFYLEQKQYFNIEKLQKQLTEGPLWEEANWFILEKYQKELLKVKLFGVLENALLFLMKQGVILSTKILKGAVDLFENRRNEERLRISKNKGNMCSEEREFYQNLLSYNEHPESSVEYFQELFSQEAKEEERKLKVKMFGNFTVRILCDGRQLSWRTKKGCELFALLYSMQGKAMNRQTILEKLWQEEMPKNAVIMLHNMIYNIRKELTPYGLDKILVYEDHKYKLNVEQIESDLCTVKWLCNMVEDKKIEELLNNQTYFKKYWGSYLANIDCQWGVICREYYDKTYQNGCMQLASYFMGFGKWVEASVYLENVLIIDNLQEEACIDLIYCYGANGNRKKVKSIYTKFCYDLKYEINVEPSEKLQATYENSMNMQLEYKIMSEKDAKQCL